MYTITKLKTFNGMEGQGFNATLCFNGKAVCEMIDDAHGGPYMFHWLDHKAPMVDGQERDYKDVLMTRKMTPNEAAFQAWILTLPKYKCVYAEDGEDPMRFTSDEIVIDDMIKAMQLSKALTSALKKKIVYVKKNALYSIKLIDTFESVKMQSWVKQLKAKEGITQVLNEMSFEDALKVFVEMNK